MAKALQIGDTTLGELRATLSLNAFHAKIRGWSRTVYVGPMVCSICGYDAHVQICHVIPVADFGLDALIREVNAPSNLIALCPNHHWEFDHGLVALTI